MERRQVRREGPSVQHLPPRPDVELHPAPGCSHGARHLSVQDARRDQSARLSRARPDSGQAQRDLPHSRARGFFRFRLGCLERGDLCGPSRRAAPGRRPGCRGAERRRPGVEYRRLPGLARPPGLLDESRPGDRRGHGERPPGSTLEGVRARRGQSPEDHALETSHRRPPRCAADRRCVASGARFSWLRVPGEAFVSVERDPLPTQQALAHPCLRPRDARPAVRASARSGWAHRILEPPGDRCRSEGQPVVSPENASLPDACHGRGHPGERCGAARPRRQLRRPVASGRRGRRGNAPGLCRDPRALPRYAGLLLEAGAKGGLHRGRRALDGPRSPRGGRPPRRLAHLPARPPPWFRGRGGGRCGCGRSRPVGPGRAGRGPAGSSGLRRP